MTPTLSQYYHGHRSLVADRNRPTPVTAPTMPTIRADRVVDAPRDELFALSQDYHRRLDWDPFLRELEFLDGATDPGVDVRVRVRAHNGLAMTVRYITFDPPRRVAVTMLDGPRFFAKFAGTWRFESQDSQATRVVFQYYFQTRPVLVRPMLDPIVGRVLTRDMQKRLAELADYVDGSVS